jgi:hypothetical protein
MIDHEEGLCRSCENYGRCTVCGRGYENAIPSLALPRCRHEANWSGPKNASELQRAEEEAGAK